VKSLLRRATAFNAVGKHRAALRDLSCALAIDSACRQCRADIQNTRELLRNASSRAPLVPLIPVFLLLSNDSEDDESGNQQELESTNSHEGAELPVYQGPDYPARMTMTTQRTEYNRIGTFVGEEEDEADEKFNRLEIILDDEQRKVMNDGTDQVETRTEDTEPFNRKVKKNNISEEPIVNGYELLQRLRGLSRRPDAVEERARLLRQVRPTATKQLFGVAREPELFYRFLLAVYETNGGHASGAKKVWKWFARLSRLQHFSFTIALLGAAERQELWTALQTTVRMLRNIATAEVEKGVNHDVDDAEMDTEEVMRRYRPTASAEASDVE